MAKDQRRDDELAAFTDALLDNTQTDKSARPPLANTVEILARTLSYRPPPASLRSRVRRCVAAEWTKPQLSLTERMRGLLSRPRHRWAWATVAALAVVTVVALTLPVDTGQTTGTLVGEIDTMTLIIILSLMVIAGIVAAWLFSRRR